ncbi:hypothetical protein KQX54_009643 [Cotesia glomerata]|uniref:Uncharacterized protein n=1 Tax=Cotesia glomerata TaxID=32391 RepID=A0AAV7J298_COTGL|nr:hypothetical protein KQX54_009643 [Cotesia glomerata]
MGLLGTKSESVQRQPRYYSTSTQKIRSDIIAPDICLYAWPMTSGCRCLKTVTVHQNPRLESSKLQAKSEGVRRTALSQRRSRNRSYLGDQAQGHGSDDQKPSTRQ